MPDKVPDYTVRRGDNLLRHLSKVKEDERKAVWAVVFDRERLARNMSIHYILEHDDPFVRKLMAMSPADLGDLLGKALRNALSINGEYYSEDLATEVEEAVYKAVKGDEDD